MVPSPILCCDVLMSSILSSSESLLVLFCVTVFLVLAVFFLFFGVSSTSISVVFPVGFVAANEGCHFCFCLVVRLPYVFCGCCLVLLFAGTLSAIFLFANLPF